MGKNLKNIITAATLSLAVLLSDCGAVSAYSADNIISAEQTEIRETVEEIELHDSPLVINEVVVSEFGPDYNDTNDNYDWVELKNISDEPVNLSDYCLSDKKDRPDKFRLPDIVLKPGHLQIIICDTESRYNYPSSGFALDAKDEDLYLSDSNGFADYAHLEGVPVSGSYGRMEGEEGFFYFASPSFNRENRDGKRFVSDMCTALTQDGVYDNVKYVDVKFSGDGDIYYTLDGSLPDENSARYDSPIRLYETTAVRAVAVQNGGLPSKSVSQTFIINEGHTLPVLSVVTDQPKVFDGIFASGNKHREMPGNIALYDDDEGFSTDCGVTMSGQTSLRLFAKKSLKIRFHSAYGDSRLKYDLFDTGYDAGFKSLCIRAGQDSTYRLFNTDMWQELALELNPDAVAQHTKPCIMYLNGEYYGVYSIKENVSKEFYSDLMDVSSGSVEQSDMPAQEGDQFREYVYHFMRDNDMSLDENYQKVCDSMDIPGFIDWCIIQGVSANEDLAYNVKAFRSSEGDGKWRFTVYDLDGAIKPLGLPWLLLLQRQQYGFPNDYATNMFKWLLENDDFKDAFLKRYGEVYSTVLSNDSIIAAAERYRSLYENEIQRDRERWCFSVKDWESAVDYIDKQVTQYDWQNAGVEILCEEYLHMDSNEILKYFPDYRKP